MYSLSLGFIIFVAIAFNNQISEFSTQIQQEYGTRFNIIANKGNTFLSRQNVLANLDKICKTEKIVKGCGYCTHPIHDVTTWLLPQIMNVGMVASGTLNIVGISPNLLSISDDGLLSVSLSKTSPYGLDYQLYAKEGSGKMIIGETYRKSLSLKDGLKSHVVVQKKMVTSQYPKLHRQLLQPLAFLKAGPIGLFSCLFNHFFLIFSMIFTFFCIKTRFPDVDKANRFCFDANVPQIDKLHSGNN